MNGSDPASLQIIADGIRIIGFVGDEDVSCLLVGRSAQCFKSKLKISFTNKARCFRQPFRSGATSFETFADGCELRQCRQIAVLAVRVESSD
jgi:hypothetical protein